MMKGNTGIGVNENIGLGNLFDIGFKTKQPIVPKDLIQLINIVPGGVTIATDLSCREVVYNPRAADFLRLRPGEACSLFAEGPSPVKILRGGWELAPENMPLRRAACFGEEIDGDELEFEWPDGVHKAALWSARPLRDDNGLIIGAIATFEEISERKQLELKLWQYRKYLEDIVLERTLRLQETKADLAKQNEKLASILDNISEGFVALDNEWRFTYINRQATELFAGLNYNGLLGHNYWEIFPKVYPFYEYYTQAVANQEPVHFEVQFCLTGGWIEVHAYPSKDGLAIFFRDIDERKKTEKALEMERQRLYSLLNGLPGFVCLVAQDYNVRFANKTYRLLFGEPGIAPCYIVSAAQREPCQNCHLDQVFITNKPAGWELTYNDRTYEIHSQPFPDSDGEPLVLIVGLDITEKRRAEQEITRLERLNLVGEMAAAIAHEVRNPMTTVRGFLQMLQTKEETIRYQDFFELMISELDRANMIITEFLSLARNKATNVAPVHINKVVESLYPLIQADALNQDKQVIAMLEEVTALPLDEREIRQLILNLARNGLEAMTPGGSLTIKTFMATGMVGREKDIPVVESEADGDNDAETGEVVLTIADQGKGIPLEILEQLGTPFFTTKEKGTGLGLAVCYSIAARHNAYINVTTGPEGTIFYVRFRTVEVPKRACS